jgi:hypothetical protein
MRLAIKQDGAIVKIAPSTVTSAGNRSHIHGKLESMRCNDRRQLAEKRSDSSIAVL